MTEDNLDPDEAADVLHDIDVEAEQAIKALQRGPGPGEVRDAIGNLERNAQELVRFAENVQQAVDDLTGGAYSEGVQDLEEGASDAYDHVQAIREMVGVVEAALDSEDSVDGTLEVGGQTFDVTLTPVEDDQPDEAADYSFGEWLAGVMDEESIGRSGIVDISLAGEDHVDAILDAEEPLAETDAFAHGEGVETVCISILKGLHSEGFISEEERRNQVQRYGWTDSDVGVTDADAEADEDSDGLGELFG